jgi:hypothetical protein
MALCLLIFLLCVDFGLVGAIMHAALQTANGFWFGAVNHLRLWLEP